MEGLKLKDGRSVDCPWNICKKSIQVDNCTFFSFSRLILGIYQSSRAAATL
jgi:hypothetical protein